MPQRRPGAVQLFRSLREASGVAPAGHRATWFALMASLVNLALVVGALQTKYLNEIFTVGRGNYGELGILLLVATGLGFVIPLAAIVLFGRKV